MVVMDLSIEEPLNAHNQMAHRGTLFSISHCSRRENGIPKALHWLATDYSVGLPEDSDNPKKSIADE